MSEAREVIDRVTTAAMEGDVTTLRSALCRRRCHRDARPGRRSGGPMRSSSGLERFRTAFPDMSWEPLHELDAGNPAFDEGFVVGTHSGPLESPDRPDSGDRKEAAPEDGRRRDRRERPGDEPSVLLRPAGAPGTARARAGEVAVADASATLETLRRAPPAAESPRSSRDWHGCGRRVRA
jgi:hypothetical protein